ncbi:MAG: 5-formyltetrahydrofolate cyclo-ligase [Pseudomonadota bacterium]|nr:5-formyltetrahydrofolate cyclo-ligase [Pseudomonadota bacterium]
MTDDAPRFHSKSAARKHAWDRLQDEGLARLPFPPHGRIPNFAGAQAAARRLFEIPVYRDAQCIKINPDSPQKHVRAHALRLGISVLVPTPKLTDGFHLLDPHALAPGDYGKAATRSTMHHYSRVLALDEVPTVDAIVTGCAAVTPEGHRCGKGAGYSDIEWGVLMELGQAPVPVATTVHDVQVLGGFPSEAHDLGLHWIVTPTRTIPVAAPPPGPRGIDWSLLSREDIAAMPLLKQLSAGEKPPGR